MLLRFFRSEPAAAIVLLCSAVLELTVANSPLGSRYEDALHTYVLGISIQHRINDGLMAVFVLLVGMEIKQELLQELLDGQLANWRSRALPGLAAIGGLAYADSPDLVDATKIGVIGGSILSALVGTVLMQRATNQQGADIPSRRRTEDLGKHPTARRRRWDSTQAFAWHS